MRAVPKPRVESAEMYRSAFLRWDETGSVRTRPRPMVADGAVLFPDQFVPIVAHPLIARDRPDLIGPVRIQYLMRFLDFTHKLELLVVNDVTLQLALGRYRFALLDGMLLDAHRIYVDEAYHALFSIDAMDQVAQRYGATVPTPVVRPQFLVELDRLCDRAPDRASRDLLKLFFVIVSETAVSDILRDIHAHEALDSGIGDMIRDHARDEGRHHVFYRDVLFCVWPQLDAAERALVAGAVPALIDTFFQPDRDAIALGLRALGLSEADAHTIIEETYTPAQTVGYARKCTRAFNEYYSTVAGAAAQPASA